MLPNGEWLSKKSLQKMKTNTNERNILIYQKTVRFYRGSFIGENNTNEI